MSGYSKVPENLTTRADVAKRLGVSAKTVDRLRQAGTLRSYHIRRSVRLDNDQVSAYILSTKEITKFELEMMAGRRKK